MKPLLVLLLTFAAALLIIRLLTGYNDPALSGKIALSVMLIFTGSAHFFFTDGMTMMVPDFIPRKKELVYLTGIIEILAAAGLLIPSLSILTAWLLILFFVLLLPANINAARKQINYQKGTANGSGLKYLWFRVPLQIFFILWTYCWAISC
ncbi:membrane protein [Pedobacter lusitanus]|uniref:Membrane protein n=1 Tax=Pedobacter lusitanus TaxID=1503925 RepID=A0A0D0FYS6_9SPHI|nr:DoxX family protein [Pedobacter lusitanus]KIO77689.1 membrane protein [Pedobacter lusitanus]